MNSFEIYKAVRTWEDMRVLEIDLLKRGKDKDQTKLLKCREVMERMSELLANDSTDVEYIVTNTFPNLKKTAWLYDYYIEENKLEHSDYEYSIFKAPLNGENKKVNSFPTLVGAVSEILSYYPELGLKTVEEAISELSIFSD